MVIDKNRFPMAFQAQGYILMSLVSETENFGQ